MMRQSGEIFRINVAFCESSQFAIVAVYLSDAILDCCSNNQTISLQFLLSSSLINGQGLDDACFFLGLPDFRESASASDIKWRTLKSLIEKIHCHRMYFNRKCREDFGNYDCWHDDLISLTLQRIK